ncbi:MAG: hypothetical protein IRY99_02725 [Isosphaeraceae bacterium]|nr:hypothetical protein [Isosphaeraceae bacterium]
MTNLPNPIRRHVLLALALAAGAIAPMARAQEGDHDKVAEAIQKAGGKVERDEKDKAILAVNFATSKATDADLEPLKGLNRVQKLTLNNTKITDAGLEHLKGLTSLRKLYLVDTDVTDAGLEALKGLTELQVLSLVGTKVTDAGLEHLKELKNLEELFVSGTKVTEEGASKLKEALPKVKIDR